MYQCPIYFFAASPNAESHWKNCAENWQLQETFRKETTLEAPIPVQYQA